MRKANRALQNSAHQLRDHVLCVLTVSEAMALRFPRQGQKSTGALPHLTLVGIQRLSTPFI